MRIFISSDIEGTNGICTWSETERETYAEYAYFASKMTDEVNAVCLGVNEYAPDAHILVKDAHGGGRNIDHARLPLNVVLNRGFSRHPHSMMNLIDPSFDAAIMTGYHSPGYSGGNPLAHTMSGVYRRVTVNGKLASEFLLNYYTSLYYGVPVVMAAGDKHLMSLVKETDPDVITVDTFTGFGASVTSEHPKKTLEKLKYAAKEAVGRAGELKPAVAGKLPKRFSAEIQFREHPQALKASYYPGARRIDDFTIGYECEDYFDFLRMFHFV